jgi:type VI secretion system protein VasJ
MSEHLEKLLEQTAELRAAIPGESASGLDVSLEPEFERIKAEIEKLTSIEGGDPDWSLVVQEGEELLRSKTKDLRLAVWATVGAVHRSQWSGFARGLVMCRALVVDMWDSVLPKRDKARANIIGWLAERATPAILALDVTRSDEDDVRLVAELVAELDRFMVEKLGDDFSGLRGLLSATKARVRDIPEPPPPPPPTPPPPPPSADDDDDDTGDDDNTDDDDDDTGDSSPPPSSRPPAPSQQPALSTNAGDADATTRTCADALVALARSMASVDPTRAWAYRLHRKGIWLPFERVSVQGGVIAGPSVDPAVDESLHALLGASRWQELVFAGEEASARFPLWLDPHRFVAIALERMGPAFNEAREAVGRETTDYVRRHPFLLEAQLEGGAPAASPETVEWLAIEAKRWLSGPQASDIGRDEDRETAQRFAGAKNLVATGRHSEGLAVAMQLARRGSDPRERFRSSLKVARLAIDAGAYEVARPILDGLVATANAHSLETWDPALCARLYAGLYECLPAEAPGRAIVFDVLCRLDPGAALRARDGGGGGMTTRAPMGSSSGARPPPVVYQAPVPSAHQGPQNGNSNGQRDEAEHEPPPPPPDDDDAVSEWADDD